MRILMFTPYVPYPPNSGGQTRTFNLIKNLSKKHEITSFSFWRTDQAKPELLELKKYCRKVEIFGRKKAWASPEKILLTGISPFPYLVNMYQSSEVQGAISRELQNEKYDLIHVETYYIMPNITKTSVPILLAEQTIEYLVYQHYTQTSKLWPIKPLLYLDVAKHKYWEKFFWQKAQKVVAMSEADKQKMVDLIPNLNVGVVPNGVDIDFFAQKTTQPPKSGDKFLFVGNFNWLQNREAVEILVSDIWPLIKKKLPQASLWIVGRSPTVEIKKMATKDIVVSEDVEDIRNAYQGANVLLAPLFGGGGTRYKILEAMASKLPVVATEIGIEGIGAIDGKHALISNDKKKLAELAVKIVNDKKLAAKISANGQKLVTNNYNWAGISRGLEEIYEQTARKD